MPLTRRTLLAAASALPLASLGKAAFSKPMLKPKALRDGDTIALVAPASALQTQEDLDKARRNIEALGFKVKAGAHALDHWGYLAGTDDNRAADLNAAFKDPDVDGIICLQGGYGAARLLDRLDYDAIRDHPKVLMGYSDVTALLFALYARSRIVTFHGPIALSTFGDFDIQNITKVIRTAEPLGKLAVPASPQGHAPDPVPTTLHGGKATGYLAGGNLSLVASLVGSPYFPNLHKHILFLEDIGEDPYRIDRMLNTLYISGAIKGVKGIVFGDFSAREEKPLKPAADPTRDFTMLQVLQNFAHQTKIPAYCGAWFGHIRDKNTIPLGVKAEIDADAQTLTILDSGVA